MIVNSSNSAAPAVYKKCGFVTVKESDYQTGEGPRRAAENMVQLITVQEERMKHSHGPKVVYVFSRCSSSDLYVNSAVAMLLLLAVLRASHSSVIRESCSTDPNYHSTTHRLGIPFSRCESTWNLVPSVCSPPKPFLAFFDGAT